MAERRTFPAIEIQRSGTRREELLFDEDTLKQVWLLRRIVSLRGTDADGSSDVTERVLERLSKSRSNQEFLTTLNKGAP